MVDTLLGCYPSGCFGWCIMSSVFQQEVAKESCPFRYLHAHLMIGFLVLVPGFQMQTSPEW